MNDQLLKAADALGWADALLTLLYLATQASEVENEVGDAIARGIFEVREHIDTAKAAIDASRAPRAVA